MRVVPIDGRVARVLVTEDRAEITRVARVELPAGPARLRLEEVAPVLADRSLAASLRGIDGASAEVLGARCERGPRRRPGDAHPDDHAGASERDQAERREARARVALLDAEAELAGVAHVASQTLVELAEDAASGRFDAERAAQALDALDARERELGARKARAADELAQARAALEALARARAASPRDEIAAAVEITADVREGGAFELELRYLVPGACWRPRYVATLSPGGDQVRVEAEAAVWQRTGEDWDGVELELSTARPSLGFEPPALVTDVVRTRRRQAAVVVEQRAVAIEDTGLGAARGDEVPGIDDGGEARALRPAGAVTVPSTGRAALVPLFAFESAASLERAVTELAPSAILRAELENRAGRPLLAGPVELVRDGGLVGRGKVLFVAPGERFELGFGAEPFVAVDRRVEQREEETGLLSSWRARTTIVTVRVTNQSTEERVIWVRERVPVSEIEKVVIEVDAKETTGKRAPDERGFLEWRLALAPLAADEVVLTYRTKHHPDVVGLP